MAIRAQLPAHGERDEELDLREHVGSADAVDVEALWQHRAELRNLSRRIVGDVTTAEDVVQDTYLRALRNLDKVGQRPTLMPWLTTVAKRRSIDMLRDRRRQDLMEDVPDSPSRSEFDPLARALAGDTIERVRDALSALNDRERRLLALQVDGGMSLDELAEEDGASVDSVRSVLARARSKLKHAIGDARVPVVAPVGALFGSIRRRLGVLNAKLQQSMPAGTGLERLGELFAVGAVAVAVGAGPALPLTSSTSPSDGGAPPAPASTSDAASSRADGNGSAVGGTGRSGGQVTAPPGAAATDAVTAAVPAGLLPGGPDEVDGPEDAGVTDFGVAQGAGGDGTTLLAAGRRLRGCTTDCTVLFRSDDAGRTWRRLSATGITGSQILLAPRFPADPRIFAAGDLGYSLSRDGGRSFQPVVGPPIGAPVAMSPGFSDGDQRVLIGSSPAWVYDDASATAAPFAIAPVGTGGSRFGFAPDYRQTGRLFAVMGGTPDGDRTVATVYRCQARFGVDVCEEGSTLSGLTSVDGIHLTSTFPLDGTVMVWGPESALHSGDGGVTFRPVAALAGVTITAVTDDGRGTTYAATTTGLRRSLGGRDAWEELGTGTPLAGGTAAVAVLPGGRIIAGRLGSAGGGLLCSDDGGSTWTGCGS